MEEVLKSMDKYVFTTSTAEVMSPDDFVVEFIEDMEQQDRPVIKIKNLDELMDFIEGMEC